MTDDAPEKPKGPLVLLAAGGTGGHLFPAEALAHVLASLNIRVALATDERVGGLAQTFPAEEVFEIPSDTTSNKGLMGKAGAGLHLAKGLWVASRLIKALKPKAVVGFGGYPTVPPIMAATLQGVPAILHEQNAVMGRANRFLAGRVTKIATGFPHIEGLPDGLSSKLVHTGNPVRPSVLQAAREPYPAALNNGRLRIVVFGGSQGARIMSEVVPAAITRLPGEALRRLVIIHQARQEDLLHVRAVYAKYAIPGDVQVFFKDLPRRISESHLVIARAGASTVAELAVIGRPAILIPLPGALDQDQAGNAQVLEQTGGVTVLPQSEFTPQRVATEIIARLNDPDSLTRAAQAVKTAAVTDAAERLATVVVRTAGITNI